MIALFIWLPTPINLDTISIDRARLFHGKPVIVNFIVSKPSYTLLNRTIVGADEWPDWCVRGAVLRGIRYDVPENRRITVVGTLWTIHHPPRMVNGVIIPAWTEIRVDQTH